MLSHGEVAEQGTHAELIAKMGVYFKLLKAQELVNNDTEEKASAASNEESEAMPNRQDSGTGDHQASRDKGTKYNQTIIEVEKVPSSSTRETTNYTSLQLIKKVCPIL